MDDYGENGLCLDCSDEFLPPHIHDYHHGADCGLVFHPREGLDNLYFGVELETDEYRACDSVAQDLFSISEDEHFFWLENDSSLINGIEIISQPCTLDYHLTSFPWARIVEVVVRNGGKSHDTTTCGLHIHFSRAFYSAHKNLYQLRLIYLFEKFWDELVVFSRRDQHQLEFNAKKYGCALFDCASSKKMEELYHNYHRYQAVNIRGKDTIELRIFRGTLDVATILASLELTDFLARLAKKTSTRKLQELTWAGIKQRIKACQYSYLLPYLSRRSL